MALAHFVCLFFFLYRIDVSYSAGMIYNFEENKAKSGFNLLAQAARPSDIQVVH